MPAAWNNMIGSVDYLDLFAPGAEWSTASSRIQVFKMYPEMLSTIFPGNFSDATLQQIFSYLDGHRIALAVEFPPLTPSATCGMGVEGFAGETALPIATRIQRLGGNLQYLAFDEPFFHGSALYTGPNGCQWTTQQIAANALQSVAQVKTVFPNVIVGDIEPVPAGSDWLSEYTAGMDAWRAAAGAPFAFFHCDIDWQDDWGPSVESLREALQQRGIPFGMIYNGSTADLSDTQWMSDAENHYAEWEAQGGTIPSHVIFQSWNAYPRHVLPESDPTALTYLIDSYFRERTKLSLKISSSQASGRLTGSQGEPIASAPITLTAQATTGPGAVANYVLSGTAPPETVEAVIQICVNECGDVGATDINVYSFQYTGPVGQTTLTFANGLAGWGVDGKGTQRYLPIDPEFAIVRELEFQNGERFLELLDVAGNGRVVPREEFALIAVETHGGSALRPRQLNRELTVQTIPEVQPLCALALVARVAQKENPLLLDVACGGNLRRSQCQRVNRVYFGGGRMSAIETNQSDHHAE